MARRKNCLTSFAGDLVDSTKDFADDLLDRAKGVETDLRKAARNVYESDEDEKKASTATSPSSADLKAITATLAELTATVNELAQAQTATTPRRTTKAAAA